MGGQRGWMAYPTSYCAIEMEIIAGWLAAGKSGSIIGPAGIGKSNLLGFLCHRPDALQAYLPAGTPPIALVLVDLNDLTSDDPATFYRLILRSFYETNSRLDPSLAQVVTAAYAETRHVSDPFLVQTALRHLLFRFREAGPGFAGVALVFDHFDHFCQKENRALTDSLRALRDTFKGLISYLVGMRQEISYLADPSLLGELYEILDSDICRVRPLSAGDARYLARRELGPADEEVVRRLITLSGGYPALLKAACNWWSKANAQPAGDWCDQLLAQAPIGRRLEELWLGLSQEEQLALARLPNGPPGRKQPASPRAADQRPELYQPAFKLLAEKGLLQKNGEHWRIFSDLLAGYVASMAGRGWGKIWLDPPTGHVYQGQTVRDNLSPLEHSLLTFLISQPRSRHSYTAVIAAVWPAEVAKQGVSNEALFQVVAGLRRKIEPDPARPCYLVNWRGAPEGGYQFFPEGRPA
jgi:hypothetical protein